MQTLVVKFRSSSRGSSLSSRSAKSGKNDSKKQELSIGALVQESLDLASQTLPEEQTLEEGNGEEGEEEMAAEYEDEYDEEEEEEEEATGGAYELTQKFQAQATKLLEALDSQIAELETELATARRDGDAEAIFEITNALTAKQAERLVLVKFKPDFNIETKMEIFSPAQSPLQSPARRRRAPGQAHLEEDPLVASLQERVQVQQELLVKLQAAASGAGLEQQVEDILEERMDAFVEHRMVRLEQMRAACRFRHLVMQGRNKTLDKREKRMQDRIDKLHSREFDVEEGERKLNEKKVREAAAAERRLLELREAQKEADELDRYRAKLEKERNDLNQRKAALDQQLGEVNFKSRQLLADRKELRKERLEFEKAKQLREMAEARKKNPKLAKKPDQAGDGGKDTDTGNISPPKSPPPKSPQAQNFDLSGDKRVLGVTELCMPLPSVWPGRSPEPKKGPGAISSIFELLQPVGPHHLLARAHGKLPMSAPQPKRAVAKGVCERSPGPDAVSQEQESGPSSAGPSSAGKKKPASSRSISRAAHVPVAADIVGWATEEEHVHSPIPQDRLPQIQDKRQAGGRGGEKDQRARSTETDAVQRGSHTADPPLQPAPVHPRDTTPTSLVSRAPSVSDAGFDFVAPLVVDEKGWADSRDGEEGLERRSSLRGFSRGSSSGKNVGFAGLDT